MRTRFLTATASVCLALAACTGGPPPADETLRPAAPGPEKKKPSFADCVKSKGSAVDNSVFPRVCKTAKGEAAKEDGAALFTSPAYAISFVHPKGWSVSGATELETAAAVTVGEAPTAHRLVFRQESAGSLDDVIVVAARDAGLGIVNATDAEQTTIGGQPAKLIAGEGARAQVAVALELPRPLAHRGITYKYLTIISPVAESKRLFATLKFLDPAQEQRIEGLTLSAKLPDGPIQLKLANGDKVNVLFREGTTVAAGQDILARSVLRPGLRLTVVGAPEKPRSKTFFASQILLSESPNIIVSRPVPDKPLDLPLLIRGQVRLSAGTQIRYILRDAKNKILTEGEAMTFPGEWEYSTFLAEHVYGEPSAPSGTLQVQLTDGREIVETVDIPVKFDKKVDVRVADAFFARPASSPECDDVFPSSHRIPYTELPMRESLIDLLRGPDAAERAAGFVSMLPADLQLIDMTFADSILTLNFNDALDAEKDPCRRVTIKAQILRTMQQYGVVRSVRFQMNGTPFTW